LILEYTLIETKRDIFIGKHPGLINTPKTYVYGKMISKTTLGLPAEK